MGGDALRVMAEAGLTVPSILLFACLASYKVASHEESTAITR